MRKFKLESLWHLFVPIKCESNGVSLFLITRIGLILRFLSDWRHLPCRWSFTHPMVCVLKWFGNLLVVNGERGLVNGCKQFVLLLIEIEFIELESSLSDESSERSILGNSVNS